MRRTLFSWPAKVMVIAVSAIGASGSTWAQPSDLLAQQSANVVTAEQEWIPAGSRPIAPKPKARDDGESGMDEYPSGSPIIPPKPKAHDDGATGMDEYPSGTPIVPPKPKSTIQY